VKPLLQIQCCTYEANEIKIAAKSGERLNGDSKTWWFIFGATCKSMSITLRTKRLPTASDQRHLVVSNSGDYLQACVTASKGVALRFGRQ